MIGLIIFALFMTTLLGFAYKLNVDLEVDVDNSTSAAFTAFDDNAKTTQTNMYGVSKDMQNNSFGGSNLQADSSKTLGDNTISTGVRVITIASQSFSIVNDVMWVLADHLTIPPVFIYSFFAIIIIIVVLIFASSVLSNRL